MPDLFWKINEARRGTVSPPWTCIQTKYAVFGNRQPSRCSPWDTTPSTKTDRMVLCLLAMWDWAIIFEDDNGNVVTVTGGWYWSVLNEFLILKPDGGYVVPESRCHRLGYFGWPARSPDLTAPDYFLSGNLKVLVYLSNPHILLMPET